MKKIIPILISVIVVVLIATLFITNSNGGSMNGNVISGFSSITVYKSAMCGCCEGYIAELRNKGYDVNVEIVQNMQIIKDKYNVPSDVQSCHTAIIGDYFVEGHVPLEAVSKLLQEKPDIDGIALKGMPAGSPGMPGQKSSAFIVYSVKEGKISEFMKI